MLLKFRDRLLGGMRGGQGQPPKIPKLKKGELIQAGFEAGKKSYQKYKEQKTSWLVYVIVGIIIIPFAFLGINYYFQGFAEDPVVLEVNDYELTLNGFNNLVQQRKQLLEQQMPEQAPPLVDIQNAVLREMIRNRVITDTLIQYDYTVPDIEVARFIVNTEQFQSDGAFDNDVYLGYLAAVKKTRSAFEDELRERIFPAQIRTAIYDSSFVLGHERSFYEKLLTEERKIRYVEFLYDDFYGRAEASTQDVAIMYERNSEKYMTEERVKVEYVDFNVIDYIDRQTAEREEIDLYYGNNIGSYTTPERRAVAHILIDTKRRNALAANELAREALKQLRQGKDFGRVVRDYSEDLLTVEQDGRLPPLAEFEIEDENIADAIFSLSLGEVSAPVSSEFGVQIFKLLDIRAEKVEPLAQVEKQIEYEIKYEKAYDDYVRAVTEFEAVAHEKGAFSSLAASLEDAKAKKTKFLRRDSAKGIFIYPDVKQAVFDLLADDFDGKQAVEVEPGRTFYVRIDDHQASKLPPLEKVEKRVIEDLRQDQAARAANQSAIDMRDGVNTGRFGSFEEAAEEYRLDIVVSEFINRSNRELPPALVGDIFEKYKFLRQNLRLSSAISLPQERKAVAYEVSEYRAGVIDDQLRELLAQRPFTFVDQEYEAFLLETAGEADITFHQDRLSGES